MAELFPLLNFAVDKRNTLVMTDVYQEIGNVSLLGVVSGTYEYGFSLTSDFNQANKSEYFRFSTDGGATWTEFSTEPADSTDANAFMYQFYKEGLAGDLNYIIQARKEDATGVMNVSFVDIWLRRVV